MELLLILAMIFVVGYFFFIGMVKAFMRNPIAAILLFLFFFPGLVFWAFFELFTDPIQPKVIPVRIVKDE